MISCDIKYVIFFIITEYILLLGASIDANFEIANFNLKYLGRNLSIYNNKILFQYDKRNCKVNS